MSDERCVALGHHYGCACDDVCLEDLATLREQLEHAAQECAQISADFNVVRAQLAAVTAQRDELLRACESGWLIWSHQHRAWWRPSHEGYTKDVRAAGLYSLADGLRICQQANYRPGTYSATDHTGNSETLVPHSRLIDAIARARQPAAVIAPSSQRHPAPIRTGLVIEELLDACEGLVSIVIKAGLLNLSRGVQLGATSWYVKASDALEFAKDAIEKARQLVPCSCEPDDPCNYHAAVYRGAMAAAAPPALDPTHEVRPEVAPSPADPNHDVLYPIWGEDRG